MMPVCSATHSNEASARSIGRSRCFSFHSAISESAVSWSSTTPNPPGGRPPQKAYLRALGKKAAGLGQHRPCGQHAAPEFLEESLDLTMVLVGAV